MPSGLFGIEHSNRSNKDHWGKNCFNSSFPAAMASYMLETNVSAIYIKLDIINNKPQVVAEEIPIHEIFRCGDKHPSDLYFAFESVFEPYQEIHLMRSMV